MSVCEHYVEPDTFDDINQWFSFIKKRTVYQCLPKYKHHWAIIDDLQCDACQEDCLCCVDGYMTWQGKEFVELGANRYYATWKGNQDRKEISTSAKDMEWHYIPGMSEKAYRFLQFIIRRSGQNMFKSNGEWFWEPVEGFCIPFKDLNPNETYCCNPALSYQEDPNWRGTYVKSKKIIGGFYGIERRPSGSA